METALSKALQASCNLTNARLAIEGAVYDLVSAMTDGGYGYVEFTSETSFPKFEDIYGGDDMIRDVLGIRIDPEGRTIHIYTDDLENDLGEQDNSEWTEGWFIPGDYGKVDWQEIIACLAKLINPQLNQ